MKYVENFIQKSVDYDIVNVDKVPILRGKAGEYIGEKNK